MGGARVEVATEKVRSFRVVKPTPSAVAQGLADAWCQVVGRVPFEISRVAIEDDELLIAVKQGDGESIGRSPLSDGWARALTYAVGRAGGLVGSVPSKLAVNS